MHKQISLMALFCFTNYAACMDNLSLATVTGANSLTTLYGEIGKTIMNACRQDANAQNALGNAISSCVDNVCTCLEFALEESKKYGYLTNSDDVAHLNHLRETKKIVSQNLQILVESSIKSIDIKSIDSGQASAACSAIFFKILLENVDVQYLLKQSNFKSNMYCDIEFLSKMLNATITKKIDASERQLSCALKELTAPVPMEQKLQKALESVMSAKNSGNSFKVTIKKLGFKPGHTTNVACKIIRCLIALGIFKNPEKDLPAMKTYAQNLGFLRGNVEKAFAFFEAEDISDERKISIAKRIPHLTDDQKSIDKFLKKIGHSKKRKIIMVRGIYDVKK